MTAAGEASWPTVRQRLLELEPEWVWTSDLRRACIHAADLGLPYRVLPELREQDFGAWDARPWAEVEASHEFWSNPVETAPPGGESFASLAARSRSLFEQLPDRGVGLILAHAGTLRALLSQALGIPLARALDLRWDTFGLSVLEMYEREKGALLQHNLPLGGLEN